MLFPYIQESGIGNDAAFSLSRACVSGGECNSASFFFPGLIDARRDFFYKQFGEEFWQPGIQLVGKAGHNFRFAFEEPVHSYFSDLFRRHVETVGYVAGIIAHACPVYKIGVGTAGAQCAH